ncbi:MAG: SRPBCC domain-containing protein [Actinomycetota bacterium]
MRHHLHTEITIDATPTEVWAVLTDLASYDSWNPFVVAAEGRVAVGERLVNRLQPPGGKAQTFKPTVTVVSPPSTFEWLGRLGLPGIFDGRHRFDLTPTADGGTHLVHQEFFSGLLVPLLRSALDGRTRHGFELMNQALKARAESSVEVDVDVDR